ncbi:trypsin-like peptidase domain-containing protein [Botrimarina sp.]|uniref:S1C family serine protease n=1 Tax=Botrimarina sp. TaxID=2795802 RepID=UPI0032ED6437
MENDPSSHHSAAGNPDTGGPIDPHAPTAPHSDAAQRPLDAAERPMFDKPNLQLRDPDPYAFANRIRKLLVIGCVLACLAAAPFVARVVAYQVRRGQEVASYEVAKVALREYAPQLRAFEETSRMVAKATSPAVVRILRPSFTPDGVSGMPPGMMLEGQGSGFVVDKEGYVITNNHVVEGAQRLLVEFTNGEQSDASIVGRDPPTDLAVLKIDGGDLPTLEWADSDDLQMGDLVWAVGSPFGLENTISFGIVSSTSRRSGSGLTRYPYQEFFQSDAAVNPGNSGGPMVNMEGKVVGVNTMIVGEFFRGVSFSIPSNLAKEKYEQLREKGYIERGYLGMLPAEPSAAERRRLQLERGEGVMVTRRSARTPAAEAGLRNGDVILRWNDHKAVDPTLLSREIGSTAVGSEARVVVRRLENGEPVDKELTVRVGRHPYAQSQ